MSYKKLIRLEIILNSTLKNMMHKIYENLFLFKIKKNYFILLKIIFLF